MWSKHIPSPTVFLVNDVVFMEKIVVAGGRVCGMAAVVVMLADDGHQVTVVERAADPVPDNPEGAFGALERCSARALGEILCCTSMSEEVMARPGSRQLVTGYADRMSTEPLPGFDREQLLERVP
jgi:2-polyprenyl-6-methoxyphenol hydroxylase-like FAD-dependent oxidoreductase